MVTILTVVITTQVTRTLLCQFTATILIVIKVYIVAATIEIGTLTIRVC